MIYAIKSFAGHPNLVRLSLEIESVPRYFFHESNPSRPLIKRLVLQKNSLTKLHSQILIVPDHTVLYQQA